MPIIQPKDGSLSGLSGLHLWHDDMSSCSQRVRAVLALKGLAWEDHLLAIPAGDTTTPAFLAINSKGLVPVLVHDGDTWTESMDIIEHLDQAFPEPPLRPAGPEQQAEMARWMKKADAAQYDLKVLSHEFLFRAVRHVSGDDLKVFESNVDNDQLVEFMRVYTDGDKLPAGMLAKSVDAADAGFQELDRALNGRDWLAGNAMSLADIAWMPNAHRYELMDWPMERYRHLSTWHQRMKGTEAYNQGIVKWEPPPAREMLSTFARTREGGYHIRNFGALAA